MEKYLYVYILKCSDGSYYTGVTNNCERRFEEHQQGENAKCYTFSRRPVELAYMEAFQNYIQAITWEKQIKGWTRAKKEALIQNNWRKLKELPQCKNDSHSKKYLKQDASMEDL
ncbi:MAG: GIY-YIG nuclease family protein [Chitinophagaceae bacterium]|nr:GIY-YIG nuclease family protein [Chitinophagaceae bacterium]